MWRQWAAFLNSSADQSLQTEKFQVVPENMHDLTEEELGFWLARFVNEVRIYYPPNSLQLLCGVQRQFNNRPNGTYRTVHILNKSNSHFSLFWNNCDIFMKMLYGQFVKQADVITDSDEKALWSPKPSNLLHYDI